MNKRSHASLWQALLCATLLSLAGCGDSEKSKEPQQSTSDDYVENMAREHAGESATASGAVQPGAVPAMPVLSETVQYGTVNGQPVTGYLAYPESAHGGLPGILMFHEWWGLNDNIRAMADTERLNANIRQGWKFMTEEIGALSVASIGWCLGGTLAFNTALLYPDQLAATVVYYGHVADTTRAQLAMLNMPILGIFGEADNGIPIEGVRRFETTLNELGKDAEIVVYEGAGHAFANPTGQSYQPEAAEDAWRRTLAFLDRTLNAAVNRNVIEEPPAAAVQPASVNSR